MPEDSTQEVRVAVFGSTGSGKTTLLSSFFGNQQRHEFEERHGYRLQAEDVAQGNELLSRYYKLEDGSFPAATERFDTYRFGLKITGLPESALDIVWYDYPGGWWQRDPKDAAERAERSAAFRKLLEAHAGILIVDAARYRTDGLPYVHALLDQFKNEIRRITDDILQQGESTGQIPSIWVLALSKADVLAPEIAAEAMSREIVADSSDQLKGVARALGTHRFGNRFLLLSSVRAEGTRVVDAHRWIGLQLIAPIVLMAVLEEAAERASRGTAHGVLASIFHRLSKIVDFVDQLDDFLPLKYQLLTKLLKAFDLKEGLEKGMAYFREQQARAARKGDATRAAVASMKAELGAPEGQQAYFKNQE